MIGSATRGGRREPKGESDCQREIGWRVVWRVTRSWFDNQDGAEGW